MENKAIHKFTKWLITYENKNWCRSCLMIKSLILGTGARVYMCIHSLYRWHCLCDLPLYMYYVWIAGFFCQEWTKDCYITYTQYIAGVYASRSPRIYLFFNLCVSQKVKLINKIIKTEEKNLLVYDLHFKMKHFTYNNFIIRPLIY